MKMSHDTKYGKLNLYLFQSEGIIIVHGICGSELENNQSNPL